LDGLFVVLPPLLYLGLSMTSHLDIGVRHILPVFPFFAVAGAGALTALGDRIKPGKMRAIAVAAFVVLSVVLPAAIYPNYLTYFSPLAGGSAGGWKRLSDSNVETGQEAKALAEFLKSRGESAVEGIFIGDGFLRFYGIALCRFPC